MILNGIGLLVVVSINGEVGPRFHSSPLEPNDVSFFVTSNFNYTGDPSAGCSRNARCDFGSSKCFECHPTQKVFTVSVQARNSATMAVYFSWPKNATSSFQFYGQRYEGHLSRQLLGENEADARPIFSAWPGQPQNGTAQSSLFVKLEDNYQFFLDKSIAVKAIAYAVAIVAVAVFEVVVLLIHHHCSLGDVYPPKTWSTNLLWKLLLRPPMLL